MTKSTSQFLGPQFYYRMVINGLLLKASKYKKVFQYDAYHPLANHTCFGGGHQMPVPVGAFTVRSNEQIWTVSQWWPPDVTSRMGHGRVSSLDLGNGLDSIGADSVYQRDTPDNINNVFIKRLSVRRYETECVDQEMTKMWIVDCDIKSYIIMRFSVVISGQIIKLFVILRYISKIISGKWRDCRCFAADYKWFVDDCRLTQYDTWFIRNFLLRNMWDLIFPRKLVACEYYCHPQTTFGAR